MKRIISIIIAFLLLINLCACSSNPPKQNSDKLKIIATIFPQYDFARQIAKGAADVQMLIPPGAESHSYEPTTSDIIDISDCDIFIYTGGESDSWINSILENTNNPDMTVISLMDCISVGIEEESHHSHHGHNHGTVDEHLWTSPVNAISIAEKICEELCKKDETNADTYKSNLKEYTDSLTELDESFRQIVNSAKRKTMVFGDRFPLMHFANEYGLEYYAAFSGCSENTEASAATVANLIDRVKEENIPVVLKIELSSDAIAKTICDETDTQMMTFYSCHNISKTDFEGGATYLSLMKENVSTLEIALN